MNIDIRIISNLLCDSDQHSAKLHREAIWTHCDTNSNGFASVADINEEFSRILNLQPSQSTDFKLLIQQSLDQLRRKYCRRSSFGDDYVQEKEFRLLVISLHRNIMTLRKFEKYCEIESRKDDGGNVEIEFMNLEIDWDKMVEIRKKSGQKKIPFSEFDFILNNEWRENPNMI